MTDGSPQHDDEHCVGTPDEQTACKIARRPECRHLAYMDRGTATQCWAPAINSYDWPHQQMFDALYCESKGAEDANNGNHGGLLQSTNMPADAIQAFHDAYYNKWSQGGEQHWRGTYGAWCPN